MVEVETLESNTTKKSLVEGFKLRAVEYPVSAKLKFFEYEQEVVAALGEMEKAGQLEDFLQMVLRKYFDGGIKKPVTSDKEEYKEKYLKFRAAVTMKVANLENQLRELNDLTLKMYTTLRFCSESLEALEASAQGQFLLERNIQKLSTMLSLEGNTEGTESLKNKSSEVLEYLLENYPEVLKEVKEHSVPRITTFYELPSANGNSPYQNQSRGNSLESSPSLSDGTLSTEGTGATTVNDSEGASNKVDKPKEVNQTIKVKPPEPEDTDSESSTESESTESQMDFGVLANFFGEG